MLANKTAAKIRGFRLLLHIAILWYNYLMKKEALNHPFAPIYDKDSRILILGTFPSVKSRANEFYYGHPQNRFWQLLAVVFRADIPQNIEEKKAFLLEHNIALWDVLASCEIVGSADSSISAPVVNDLTSILKNGKIEAIYTNGKKAKELYDKYIYPKIKIKAQALASTSPANRRFSMAELITEWEKIK
ncbi:MAG: DNA-deoxyinosine glycosylase [Clostridiales bacterium]